MEKIEWLSISENNICGRTNKHGPFCVISKILKIRVSGKSSPMINLPKYQISFHKNFQNKARNNHVTVANYLYSSVKEAKKAAESAYEILSWFC